MVNQIKVLHLNSSGSGGAYMFSENLVNGFKMQNQFLVDQLIFTGKNNNFKILGIDKIDNLIKFSIHAFEKVILYFFLRDKKYLFKFSFGWPGISYWLLNRYLNKYDIIHLHWVNKGFINIKQLKRINKPIVWTCHDIWLATGGCHLTYGCNKFESGCGNCPMLAKSKSDDISKKIFNSKSETLSKIQLNVVSPSFWLAEQLKKSEILKFKNIQVINNGIDTKVFCYKRHHENNLKIKIAFVAQNLNDENKALYRLINALDLLPDKKVVQLILIGGKKKDFEFEIPVEYEIIEDANSIYKMSELYQSIDVLVCSSTIETYPTTIMEAACCGVKCVGFDVGGVKEILDLCSGTAIQPFDIIELSKSIQSIDKSSINREKISELATQNFSILKTVEGYKSLYESIIPSN